MGVVMFYHLTRSDGLDTADGLIRRALKQDWRVMVRGGLPDRLQRIDQFLWEGGEDDFLPHGMEGGPHDADQPVLIGAGPIGNAAQALVLLDGAETTPDEAAGLERVWVIFDGADEARLAQARDLWRRVRAAELEAQYWSEEGGSWQKKA